jgi:mandelate racemase
MKKLTIRNIRVRPVSAPLKRPPRSASGEIPTAPLALVDLETDEGPVGRSYLFAFSDFLLPPLVSALNGLAPLIKGDQVSPVDIDAKLRTRLTLFGTNGTVGLALSGIDMAAWDALAQASGVPLVKLLGGNVRPVRAYNSCGLWIKDPGLLADEAQQLMEEGGFRAVKLRIGRDDFKQDLAAVRNVKKRIGDDVPLMTDFNQRLTVNEAIRRGRALDDEGLYWIEEPVRQDDYAGYATIAREVKTPIQIGENLPNTFEMQKAIEAKAAEFYMPDVQRIGGVTGWLRAAALAQAHGLDMSSHLFPEYSAHLLAVTPTCHWLEYMDWANAILAEPFKVTKGQVEIPDKPGSGIAWDEAAVKNYAIA